MGHWMEPGIGTEEMGLGERRYSGAGPLPKLTFAEAGSESSVMWQSRICSLNGQRDKK